MSIHIDPLAIVQKVTISNDDLKFKTPFTMCVSGASMSGKSEFLIQLLTYRQQMFDVEFEQVYYCQPESLIARHNPIYERIQQICPTAQLVVGLPNISKLGLNLDTRPKLVLIDDLMDSFLNCVEMVTLLSIQVHHFNITTIFTLQNFFAPSKFGKTLAKNVNYRCIFYNRLDITEIRTMASQISMQPRFLIESFEFLRREFPSQPQYIILDGHSKSPLKELFVRSQIFPSRENNEIRPLFFFPKRT